MRSDVQQIHTRINLLERSLGEVKNQQLRKKVNINIEISVLNFTTKSSINKSKILDVKYPTWWPFAEISPTWFIFMIVWPFLAHRIMQTIQKKKWCACVSCEGVCASGVCVTLSISTHPSAVRQQNWPTEHHQQEASNTMNHTNRSTIEIETSATFRNFYTQKP